MRYDLALARRVALILGVSFATLTSALADGRSVLPPKSMVDAYVSGISRVTRDSIVLAMIPGVAGAAMHQGGAVGPSPLTLINFWQNYASTGGNAYFFLPGPPAAVAGDLFVAFVMADGPVTIAPRGTGWTTHQNENSTSSFCICSRIITAGELGGSIYVDTSSSYYTIFTGVLFRGGSGLVSATGYSAHQTANSIAAPSISPANTGILIASYFEGSLSASSTHTTPSGMTRVDAAANTDSAIIYKLDPSPSGATGTKTSSMSGSASKRSGIAQVY